MNTIDDIEFDGLDATGDREFPDTSEAMELRHLLEAEQALLCHELEHYRFLQTRIVASAECAFCGFARRYHLGRRCSNPNVYTKTLCKGFVPCNR